MTIIQFFGVDQLSNIVLDKCSLVCYTRLSCGRVCAARRDRQGNESRRMTVASDIWGKRDLSDLAENKHGYKFRHSVAEAM